MVLDVHGFDTVICLEVGLPVASDDTPPQKKKINGGIRVAFKLHFNFLKRDSHMMRTRSSFMDKAEFQFSTSCFFPR